MPLPSPNLYPAFNIVRASHIEFTVRDLAASRAFYADTLGLQVTAETAEHIYLRGMEERGHHSLVLRQGDAAVAGPLGFKVFDEADLDRLKLFFASKELACDWADVPHQGRTLRALDPLGVPLEFYARMERRAPVHQKYAQYRGVKPLRIDHFNCFSPDVDAATNFYNELGFRVTEYSEDAESGLLWAVWMHRKGGVHDIAFTNGTGPRLHHVAFLGSGADEYH